MMVIYTIKIGGEDMEESKLGKEPAFPVEVNVTKPRTTMGISKRFYAACAAMQGIMASSHALPSTPEHFINIVEDSYRIADELLKQENL